MELTCYCIVIIGNNDNVLREIKSVSEMGPNSINHTGLLIATFTSFFTANELDSLFRSFDRNFLIFNLNSDDSRFNITQEHINKALFGFLKDGLVSEVGERTEELLKAIKMSSDTTDFTHMIENASVVDITKPTIEFSISDLEKLSSKDKELMLNNILDKGIENLSEKDKIIMGLLSK